MNLPQQLVQYGVKHLGLSSLDAISAYNQLLPLFKVSAIDHSQTKALTLSFNNLKNELSLHFDDLESYKKESMIHQIFHLISPSPSQVNASFWSIYKEDKKKCFDYLLSLQIANDYVKQSAIDNNIKWSTEVDGYPLEITINVSKPEKKNTETAKLLIAPTTLSYPQCLLCKENLGFSGTITHPSRQNLRVIDFQLNDQPWFLQYSPYAYFPYHSIVIDEHHTNMTLSDDSLSKLYAFVDLFPDCFIGSNSDLPIIGGSILNHAHFQAGIYTMPMMKANIKKTFLFPEFRANLHLLDWFNTAIRIDCDEKDQALTFLSHLFSNWKSYSAPHLSIFNSLEEVHNSITVIVKKVKSAYQTFVILRNNATSKIYPEGIFHAHPEHHAIKQESIGLIEAMGLFILPGRLKQQLKEIETLIDSSLPIPESLAMHHHLIHHIRQLQPTDVTLCIREFINETCASILRNTSVFSSTKEGNLALEAFIHGLHQSH